MGRYINSLIEIGVLNKVPNEGKAEFLVVHAKATPIGKPDTFIPDLVCVVDNGFFEAAGYCYDEREFECFIREGDTRPKQWLIVPNADKIADK